MTLKPPMLAPHESVDLDQFKDYPVYVSPKYDGIRCLIDELGFPVSRTMKSIPNTHIRRALITAHLPAGLDGELVSYTTGKMDKYNQVQSAVMCQYGTPAFLYHVFDIQMAGKTFIERLPYVESACAKAGLPLTQNLLCSSQAEVEQAELSYLQQGFEGVMLKIPHGRYKHGRCTLDESIMFKLKRFVDSEALVIGIYEEMENTNPVDYDFAGHLKRGHSLEGMVPKGRMGKLYCRDIHHPEYENFKIGTGFTFADKDWWWNKRSAIASDKTIIKYKYQLFGMDKRPRQPVYLGLRSPIDL